MARRGHPDVVRCCLLVSFNAEFEPRRYPGLVCSGCVRCKNVAGAASVVVSLRYVGDDDVERYLLGSIEERREGISVVSPNSPLGQALMGHRVGDQVSYDAPSGTLEVEVVEIGR